MAAAVATPLRDRVLALARETGFPLVRFAPAALLAGARAAAHDAESAGRLADMAWMTSAWLDRATDPGAFLEGARTVVVVALPCHAPDPPATGGGTRGRVARYARGRDYHRVFESKLRRLAKALREELGAQARTTVDYGPLLERPLAAVSGLGWFGKSTMILAPGFGPWVLLGALATDLVIDPDPRLAKSCGACTRCVVACPTGAISPEGGVVDSRLCISYHTIENRGPIPRELRPKFGDWIFGCDDCLDSCPVGAGRWESHADFEATAEAAFPPLAEILALDEAAFAARFRGRAIMRAKRDGLVRNACVALGNVGAATDLDPLLRALADPAPLVRGHAAWAAAELVTRVAARRAAVAAALEALLAREQDAWVRDEAESALARLRA
jgi:epoxyqueuosine reductase